MNSRERGRTQRWTRHSIVLVGAGAIYIAIGIAFFYTPEIYAKAPSLKVALELLTFDTWGVIFVVCGALAMSASVSTLGHKTWGYVILTAISTAWAAMYAMAIIFEHAPILTIISVLSWGLLAFIWWGVSGLISPEHLNTLVDYDRD